VLLHDPSSSLQPHRAQELVDDAAEASGLPVGLYCQGAGGNALAAALEAARAGADLIAVRVYPVALTLHRVSGEALATALAGLGLDTGVDVDALWEASELVDEHIGDEPVTPLAPRIAVRAAEHTLPPGSSPRSTRTCARRRAATARRGARRAGEDPRGGRLAAARAPIGQILGSQALLHVLSASRYQTWSTSCAR
jgi:pyruvate/oxaloacetate carboxyltransferase